MIAEADRVRAFNAGGASFDDGGKLNDNPFSAVAAYGLFKAWRQGFKSARSIERGRQEQRKRRG